MTEGLVMGIFGPSRAERDAAQAEQNSGMHAHKMLQIVHDNIALVEKYGFMPDDLRQHVRVPTRCPSGPRAKHDMNFYLLPKGGPYTALRMSASRQNIREGHLSWVIQTLQSEGYPIEEIEHHPCTCTTFLVGPRSVPATAQPAQRGRHARQ